MPRSRFELGNRQIVTLASGLIVWFYMLTDVATLANKAEHSMNTNPLYFHSS